MTDASPTRAGRFYATLDGEDGFGFVIELRAMQEAIAMTREYGIVSQTHRLRSTS